jgi:hypothetical protein
MDLTRIGYHILMVLHAHSRRLNGDPFRVPNPSNIQQLAGHIPSLICAVISANGPQVAYRGLSAQYTKIPNLFVQCGLKYTLISQATIFNTFSISPMV